MTRDCSVDQCAGVAVSRGWCTKHYQRWRAHGSPLLTTNPHYPAERRKGTRRPIAERFWEKVDRTGGADGCWEWQAGLNQDGYGIFFLDGHMRSAHRVAYELAVGPLVGGVELDHLCRVRRCVNPSHLEPVSKIENWKRGISPTATNSSKTHCIRGHEFSDGNTYMWRGTRICRACRLAYARGR